MQMRLLPINILPRITSVRTNKRACCANQETTKRDYYSEEFSIHERTREYTSSVSSNGSSQKTDYHRMPIVAAVVAHRRLFPQTGSSAAGSKRSSCAVKLSALSILTPPLGAVGLKGACKKASAAFSSGGVVGNFTGGGATCRPLIDLKHIGALIKGPKGDVLQECRRYYAKGRDKPKSNKSKIVINENEIAEVIDVDKFRKQLEKLVDEMKDDFTKQLSIRGAAGALESLQVEFDGETYPLQELAQVGRKNPQLAILNLVSLPDAIQPVLKAIQESGMNLSPQQEGTTIYVPLPKVTREHRENLSKNAKALFTKYKTAMQAVQNKYVKQCRSQKELSEDLIFSVQQQIQKFTDNYIVEAEKLLTLKQKELLENK